MLTLRRLGLAAMLLAVSLGVNAALIEGNLATAGDGLITIDTSTGLEWLDFDQNRIGTDETVANAMARVMSGTYATEDGFRIATAAEVATLFQNANFLDEGELQVGAPYSDLYWVYGSWSSAVMLGAEQQCYRDNSYFNILGCEWQVKGLHAGANAGEWQYSQFDCGAFGEDPVSAWNPYLDFCPWSPDAELFRYSLGNTVNPDQLGSSLQTFKSIYSSLEPPGVFMVRATVPLPAAAWFFTAGLGMLGGLGWLRRRGGAT